MLSVLTKTQVRLVARRAWIESANNRALAEEMFRGAYAKASQQTVDELTAFAGPFWDHWDETNTSEPSVVSSADEPMGFED